jgi:hypothetical protein
MRPFTPWGGVDSPSCWVHDIPRIMVPNSRTCRYLCIASFYHCHFFFSYALHSWLERFYPHYSLVFCRESSAGTYEDDRKSTSGNYFSVLVISNLSMRTGLLLPQMLELDFIFFPNSMFLLFFCYFFSKKKKWWERCCNICFSFVNFLDITCTFTWFLSSLCCDKICLYMIEILSMIFAKFLYCI